MKYRLSTLLILLILLIGVVPLAAQEATPEATPQADAYPVTIKHEFGSATIAQAPRRVVAIGYTEQDYLLALGVTPVAVRYWYGDENNAIFPWAKDYVQGDTPIVLNMPFGMLTVGEMVRAGRCVRATVDTVSLPLVLRQDARV